MRRSPIRGLISVLVLFSLAFGTALLWEFTTDVAALEHLKPTAPVSPRQNITFDFPFVNFSSPGPGPFPGPGQSVFGQATVSGNIQGADLSRLRGTLDFPLKDYGLTLDPTGPIRESTFPSFVFWIDPFTGLPHNAVFNVTTATVPVGIHFSSFHGEGSLSFGRASACISDCPPPGVPISGPIIGSNLNGVVGGTQGAGTLSMSGPSPTIQ
jgi:hypothetical protein